MTVVPTWEGISTHVLGKVGGAQARGSPHILFASVGNHPCQLFARQQRSDFRHAQRFPASAAEHEFKAAAEPRRPHCPLTLSLPSPQKCRSTLPDLIPTYLPSPSTYSGLLRTSRTATENSSSFTSHANPNQQPQEGRGSQLRQPSISLCPRGRKKHRQNGVRKPRQRSRRRRRAAAQEHHAAAHVADAERGQRGGRAPAPAHHAEPT